MKRVLIVLVLAVAGCSPAVQEAAVAPIDNRPPDYVKIDVLDVSGSSQQLGYAERMWAAFGQTTKDFYRGRAGDHDVLLIGQISNNPESPLFRGSPKQFGQRFSSAAEFQDLLRRCDPNGSRVHLSIADVLRMQLPHVGPNTQALLCVWSDMAETWPEPEKSERELINLLSEWGRKGGYVCIFWCHIGLEQKWRNNLLSAGIPPERFRITTTIDVPSLPRFDR